MNRRIGRLGLVAIAAVGLLAGCAKPASVSVSKWPDTPLVPRVELGAGDALEIQFLYWPELNAAQQVRPDGRIALQMIDEVDVQGLTPAELDARLTEMYQGKIKDPEITVVVREMASQRFFVTGEVLAPGDYPLLGRMNVLQAIAQAGGFNKVSAKRSQVVVVRQVDGQLYARTLDLKDAYERGIGGDLALAPNDIVYIPRTWVDRADQWVSQHINQLMPEGFRYIYTYSPKVQAGYSTN